jgi:membrane protein implicated in regulation of membrane protease activity
MIENFTNLDYLFLLCALSGSLFFVLKLFSFTPEEAVEGSSLIHDGHVDTFDVFKWISVHSLCTFFTFFGWIGLYAHAQANYSPMNATAISFFSGLLAIFMVSLLFKSLRKLTNPGATFALKETLDKEAQVYHRIPKGGRGRIHLSIKGIFREIDAESKSSQEIPAFTAVKIIQVKENHVVVERS